MSQLLNRKTALTAALTLMAFAAQAQMQAVAPSNLSAPQKSATTPEASPATARVGVPSVANAEPRYAAGDLARAFSFMDGNKDGKVSRDEAARFRNVAKHFDAADTNRNAALSQEEFSSAMNRPKKR